MNPATTLKPVLKDDQLYIGDNGAVFHGCHAGMSARYSGYDLSGRKVTRLSPAAARENELPCERCGSIELE